MQRRISNGVTYYVSPQLLEAGVKHAFSTRIGGVSGGPFSSLNLGNPNGAPVQDEVGNIRENYRRLAEAAGLRAGPIRRVHQVHGCAVVRMNGDEAAEYEPKADALVSDCAGCVLSVRVADCVPVLVVSADGRAVAAVHAGWRGVIAGVVPAALAELKRMGHGDFLAAIGPCIGMEAFEVGMEVVQEFEKHFGGAAPVRRASDGKGRVDLRQAVRLQLAEAGVSDGRIDVSDRCTCRDADEFFSHRRDRGITGRMAALVESR